MEKNQLKLKVAIIGAGITGLYLAWKLSEQGHKVTVFEKKDKIGKEACSGLFSERILGFIPQSRKLVRNHIEAVSIHFPKKTIQIKFSKLFLLMSHAELDRLVAKLAQEAGAKIILSSSVGALPQGFDRVIGCDGANSTVRKSLGVKDPDLRLGIQGFVSEKDSSNYVETWAVEGGFTPHHFSRFKVIREILTNKSGAGFIWRIPRGNEVEYGIISSLKDARLLFDGFLTKKNIKIEKFISAPIPQGLIIPKNNSVTICGDAAGLTKPWSGGGVVWGLTAANLLLKNFPDFVKYQIAVKKFFLPKIVFAKIVLKTVYFLGFNASWLLPKNIKIEGDFLL